MKSLTLNIVWSLLNLSLKRDSKKQKQEPPKPMQVRTVSYTDTWQHDAVVYKTPMGNGKA